MNIHYKFSLCLFLVVMPASALFDYDRAVSAAQKGDFEKADTLLSAMVTHHPDNPELLYDAGIVASEKKDFERARVCFQHAGDSPACSQQLKEQSYFNGGNACVELKELEQAIKQYENVLKINAHNERARHNLEVVKKMLEQQQQQKNKDQNKDKDNDQKKDQEKKNQDQKQQNQDKKDQQQQNKDDQQQDEKKQNKSDSDQQKQDKNKSDSERDQQQEQQKQQQDQEENRQSQQQQEQQKQQQKKQEQSAQQGDEQRKDGLQQQQAQAGKHKQQPEYDEQVMGILNAIEKKDAQANKKMMAAQIKQAAGHHESNKNNY